MNAREVLQAMERGIYPDDNPAFWKTCRDALRLLAAADEEGTPEVDARVDYEIRAGVSLGESAIYDLARRLERERNAALKALAECREDAERYRWMRSQPTADIYACWYPPVFPSCPDTPEQRDAAIDAALAAIRGK